MSTTAIDLVKDISGLVTLPDVFFRINQLLDNPKSSANDIAAAISRDPAFTLRLLQVANSSFYRFSSAISTVARAVSVIGTTQIRNLALSISVAKTFAGLPNSLVSMDNFWKHSLFCALIARRLAQEAKRCDPDAVFTGGLLHDIGELVIFNRCPEVAKVALEAVLESNDELPVHVAEQQELGFDHSEVGAELARQWHLPPLLEECIACHHNVAAAKKHPREVAIIHIANSLAQLAEIDSRDLEDAPAIDPLAWELTGLNDDVVDQVIADTQGEIDEITQLFSGQT